MTYDTNRLLERLRIRLPLIGFYDSPDILGFGTVVEPDSGRHVCVFEFFRDWLLGKTLRITRDNFGCGGAGTALCGVNTRSRQDYVSFLVDGEGLKENHDIMGEWIDKRKTYHQKNPNILIGPLVDCKKEYLKTVTFFVNPDQLSALVIGAHYRHRPGEPPPVLATFGSGCMQLITPFDDLSAPMASIGSTDIAMRSYLPSDIMAFTVTVPMYEQLISLDENSFLNKPFLKNLWKARGYKE